MAETKIRANNNQPITHGDRLNDIDAVKGVGIVLMVIGHSGAAFSSWIYLFHMAIFFVASGYLWNDKHSDSLLSIWKYTKKKLKTLWLPCALGNSLFFIISNLCVNVGLYSNNPYFLEIAGYDASLIQLMNTKQIVVEVIKSFLFVGGSQLGGALWFLRCMFVVNIVHCCICWVLKNRSWYKPALYVVFLLSLGAAWYVSLGHWQFLHGLKTEFAAYVAYLIGIWLRSLEKYKVLLSESKGQIGTLVTSFMGLCVLSRFGTVSLSSGHIVNPGFFVFATIFGWLMLHSTAKLIQGKEQVFTEVNKASVQVMVFHFLAFKLVSWIYLIITKKPEVLLASFPVIVDVPAWIWVFYSIAGLIIPYVIYRIWSLMKDGLHRL